MILTDEQKLIVNSNEDLIVEARAGTGKTSTLIQYSLKNNDKKKLYFAFNKSIAEEAKEKFAKAGVKNITISTAHSLAYKSVIAIQKYTLGYNLTVYGVSKEYNIDRKLSKFVHLAIKKFEAFCNSSWDDINTFDFESTLSTERSKQFYKDVKSPVDHLSSDIWNDMISKKISCSHSFYLKKYQLDKPNLKYDIIMLDEGQDANEVILDIFLSQTSRKIIVGDNHQAIYGWRGAVNALTKVPYKKLYLTESFRFPQYIADYALQVLQYKEGKEEGFDFSKLKLIGRGKPNQPIETKAIISRSNLALLDKIFEMKNSLKTIYIEGGLESLTTYQNFDILELLYLKTGQRSKIKNYLLHSFKSMKDLANYFEDLDDTSIGSAIAFIDKYEFCLESYIEDVKLKLVSDQSKTNYVFSTIHKAKGKEWDQVEIISPNSWEEGFPHAIPETVTNKLTKKTTILTEDDKLKMKLHWIEELNIYYVAATRAKSKLIHSIEWIFDNNTNLSDSYDLEKIEDEVEERVSNQKINLSKINQDQVAIEFLDSGRKAVVSLHDLKTLIQNL